MLLPSIVSLVILLTSKTCATYFYSMNYTVLNERLVKKIQSLLMGRVAKCGRRHQGRARRLVHIAVLGIPFTQGHRLRRLGHSPLAAFFTRRRCRAVEIRLLLVDRGLSQLDPSWITPARVRTGMSSLVLDRGGL
jgi:hypothetical protein